jgi:hypothetical protein
MVFTQRKSVELRMNEVYMNSESVAERGSVEMTRVLCSNSGHTKSIRGRKVFPPSREVRVLTCWVSATTAWLLSFY